MQAHKSLTTKLGTTSFSNLVVNPFSLKDVVYNKDTNTSVLKVSGTVNVNDVKNTFFKLSLDFNWSTNKYTASSPIILNQDSVFSSSQKDYVKIYTDHISEYCHEYLHTPVSANPPLTNIKLWQFEIMYRDVTVNGVKVKEAYGFSVRFLSDIEVPQGIEHKYSIHLILILIIFISFKFNGTK